MNKQRLISFLQELEEDIYIPPSYFCSKGNIKKENSSTSDIVDIKDNREIELERLKKEVDVCKKCRLGYSRIKPVFGMGNPYAKVMFIGEGPGWEEDHQGLPFVGKAGQLLDKILLAIGLDRTKVYITNVVKCHPMINPETPQARGNDRPPTQDEIAACMHYINQQINIIKPKCIVTLGNTATRFILNETQGVSALRGRFYTMSQTLFNQIGDIKVLPTYHPAALLRNPSLKKETWQDMKMLKKFLESV